MVVKFEFGLVVGLLNNDPQLRFWRGMISLELVLFCFVCYFVRGYEWQQVLCDFVVINTRFCNQRLGSKLIMLAPRRPPVIQLSGRSTHR